MTEVIEIPQLSKANMKVLEQAFMAEIGGRMFQRQSQRIRKLAADGYLQPIEQQFTSALGFITCKGWELTHAGRLTYCASCK